MQPSSPDQSMALVSAPRIPLELPADQLRCFFPLLQKGVTIPATVGCSLKSLLCQQLAIPEAYVTDRVTTIFCDNHPVDDLERTIIQDGSRIALSAAMPGLVGATMRRGGFYAALRQGISQLLQDGGGTPENGTITIKLFNLLLGELGPTLLAHGVLLDTGEMTDLLPYLFCLPEAAQGSRPALFVVTFQE